MASSKEFVDYIWEQLQDAGEITSRKMFGEYTIYCDGKVIGLVCDNQLFLKVTKAGEEILTDCEKAPPYEGAKPCFLIEDTEDRELLGRLVRASYEEIPAPKPKKKK